MAVVSATLISAADVRERAHVVRARLASENGLEKRGSGKLTWYAGGMLDNPACGGGKPGDGDMVVAVAQNQGYGSCNQKVRLSYQGKSVTATVRDYCEGCNYGHFDATKGVFSSLASLDEGVLTGLKFELM
ncbi:hypothetical protein MSPP1_001885 [Malassezia sp. CBS 17886]|nr:hypothetical protein MSPP1_001885 [Malassezia sp. CBS 17886]